MVDRPTYLVFQRYYVDTVTMANVIILLLNAFHLEERKGNVKQDIFIETV